MNNLVFLTQSSNMFTGWIAQILGLVIDLIYNISTSTGIVSLGVTIIVFTFIVRMIMFPLMYKSQKSMVEMKKVQPEYKQIQEKYKGKKDAESQQKMQIEVNDLYKKHGVNPFGGCLPLLVQLPVMFALFDVLRKIPAYIGSVKNIYLGLVEPIKNYPGFEEVIKTFADENKLKVAENQFISDNRIIDFLQGLDTSMLTKLSEKFTSIKVDLLPVVDQIKDINYFFGINLTNKPTYAFPAIIIVILAVATTALQSYVSMKQNSGTMDAQTAATNKTMMYIMPIMTFMFVFQMPAGLGLYWIAGGVVGILQTLYLNKIFNKKA